MGRTVPETASVAVLTITKNDGDGKMYVDKKCEADPGELVRWVVPAGEVVSVWFPEPGIFATPVVAVQHEGNLEIRIPDTVVPGTYEYCIYCHGAKKFVEFESHPKIEVPRP